MSKPVVGFIGLGVMGRPMAINLLRAGHSVVVHDVVADAVSAVVAEGGRAAACARDVASVSQIQITMLPDSPQVAEAVEGPDGLFAGADADSLWIDMSSIAPGAARDLAGRAAARGLAAIDAPVSGGDVGAQNGTLSIMVGGASEDVARARPVLEVLGARITHCGPVGSGQVVKAANQVVVALSIEAVSEALVLAASAGVDPAVVLDVLGGGLAANKVMEVRRENFLDHDFAPGFRVDLHRKDLRIALAAAAETGADLRNAKSVASMFDELADMGHGGDDHSALLILVEQRSNFRTDDWQVAAGASA